MEKRRGRCTLDLLDHSDIRHPLKVRSEADLGRKALCAHTVTPRVTVDHRISPLPNTETKKIRGPAYPRLHTQPMPLKQSRRISKGIEWDIKNPCNINVQNVTEKPSGFILKK